MEKRGAIKKLFYCCIIVLGAIFLFNSTHCKAEESVVDPIPVPEAGHLVINEIYSHAGSGENEWIEIYNPLGYDQSLDSFTIEDGTHIPSAKLNRYLVKGGEYLVLEKGIDFTFSLNDSGDELMLKNGIDVVDQVSFGDWASDIKENNAIAPQTGRSISRISGGEDTNIDSIDFKLSKPSPGEARFIYSDDITISELFPCPTADSSYQKAFIELYYSGTDTVDISEWSFSDKSKGNYPILSGQLSPEKRYLALEYNSLLNKTTDEIVYLLDPNGDIKNETELYLSHDVTNNKGMSYSYFLDDWAWTSHLTPNEANIADQIVEKGGGQTLTILEAKKLVDGTATNVVAIINGFVTAVPGQLSLEYFYIQDASGGIQIYKHDKIFPILTEGDFVEVIGIIYKVSGEYRIKISDPTHSIKIIPKEPKAPKLPKETVISDITADQVGQYIKTTGTVTQTSGDTFSIADEKGKEIKVIIKEGANIDKPAMKKGDVFQISGVLSTYNGAYRILPFKQEDVKMVSATSATLPMAGTSPFIYLISAFLIIFIWNIFPILKRKL